MREGRNQAWEEKYEKYEKYEILNSNLRILNSIFNSLKSKKGRKEGWSKGKPREAWKLESWKVGKLGIYKLSKQSLNSNLRILNSICNSRGKKV